MKYRNFGNLDWKVSALGFGAMRLPLTRGKTVPFDPNVDKQESINMMRYAIDHGVNYLDTAYLYHSGVSEQVVGEALKDGYREKVRLVTKMPSWAITSQSDMDRFLNKQLERLQTDYLDCYLLHSMNKDLWPKLRDLNVLAWAENNMAGGKFRHLGFSFHDHLNLFKEIVDAYDNWTLCQIQYNFMDTEFQAGTEGLHYAAEKGLAVVIMEPLRGGQLTKEPPPFVKKLWEGAGEKRSPADWALQWLWHQPEVSVVLSGMSTMQHVVENIVSANHSHVGLLNPHDLNLIEAVRDAYRKLCPVPCTGCSYCMPCPNNVDIPHAFTNYNDAVMYDDSRTARFLYRQKANALADNCIECGECEEKCPQGIPIIEWLQKAHDFLGPRK